MLFGYFLWLLATTHPFEPKWSQRLLLVHEHTAAEGKKGGNAEVEQVPSGGYTKVCVSVFKENP